ncbi:hypothetical protein [Alkalibacterium sp. 20]|uniref:hypothetical protein n=1 Tax=Alkalibacterium sp. 20 TaxID=1798803 RepID=UPI0008FFE1C9|nr:hypothetical protein [Alkalibacterium sp. 20]OJF95488.1 hypothetical protein AX762_06495 [Alkalibacterium sp. 20]
MKYMKLVSLLAVSTLALAACDTDEEPVSDPEMEEGTEETDGAEVEETDETTEESDEENGQNAHDIIDDIEGDLDYTSSVELEVTGGTWSQDGYIFTPEEGEATISGSAASAEEDAEIFAFVMQDGAVIDKPAVEEGAFTYTVSATDADQEFQVGVSDEDLWEGGDEADAEELVRYENIIVSASQGE